ncbi:MAG: hypothetical protein QOF01_1166, partial [Thermomicrobiales bacterium]|nr:hypothetical protein [Thermomicrobiales bacterium]
MGHLEEEEVGELLDVVAVGEAVVAADVAIVPEFLDDLSGVGGGHVVILRYDVQSGLPHLLVYFFAIFFTRIEL